MNATAWRLVHAYRDQFGVHGASGRTLDRLRNAFMTSLRRASTVLRRRMTLEESVWLLIAALIVAFFLMLVLGDVGHGGYGRF